MWRTRSTRARSRALRRAGTALQTWRRPREASKRSHPLLRTATHDHTAVTQAIVSGLKESVHDFSATIPGVNSRDVLELMLVTQHFDLLRDIGGRHMGFRCAAGAHVCKTCLVCLVQRCARAGPHASRRRHARFVTCNHHRLLLPPPSRLQRQDHLRLHSVARRARRRRRRRQQRRPAQGDHGGAGDAALGGRRAPIRPGAA